MTLSIGCISVWKEKKKKVLTVINKIFIDQAHNRMYLFFLMLVHNEHILYMHTHLNIDTLHIHLKSATDKHKGHGSIIQNKNVV